MTNDAEVTFGGFTFNFETKVLRHMSGTSTTLSPQRAAMLHELALQKEAVVNKEILFENYCKRSARVPEPKILDVQICNLRTALDGLYRDGGLHIITEWGKGYKLSNTPGNDSKAFKNRNRSWQRGMGQRLGSVFLNAQ